MQGSSTTCVAYLLGVFLFGVCGVHMCCLMEGRLSMSSLLLSTSNDSRAPRSLDAFDEIATLPWFIRVILSIVQLVYHALHECFELVVHSLGCA